MFRSVYTCTWPAVQVHNSSHLCSVRPPGAPSRPDGSVLAELRTWRASQASPSKVALVWDDRAALDSEPDDKKADSREAFSIITWSSGVKQFAHGPAKNFLHLSLQGIHVPRQDGYIHRARPPGGQGQKPDSLLTEETGSQDADASSA